MDYRREVDGLRALAVLPVILFHAGFQSFSGGFVGVDTFFVISGYLITCILLAEQESGKFTIVNFYERRARRILPALFVVMLACLPFAWFWLTPPHLKSFSQSLVAVSLFSSNILFLLTSNYFESATELKPLLHTWSLAVEEQYYVFFPIFLTLTWRLGKRWILIILAALALTSLAAAQWGSSAKPEATFYLLPTRGWELLIGAFAAFYLRSNRRINFSRFSHELGSTLGLALLVYATFFYTKQTPFPSLYTLTPALGAVLIILFANPKTMTGRLLGSRILVGIGLISYSAYLWHQPLFAFAKHRSLDEPGKPLMTLLSIVAMVLAYFSWKYIETPFRNKQRFDRRQIFFWSAVGSLFFIGLGLTGTITKGFPSRAPTTVSLPELEMPQIDNGWCFYSVDSIKNLNVGAKGLDCWLGDKNSNKKGIFFGDSFAGQYEPLWQAVGLDSKVSLHVITTNWCYPSSNEEFTGPHSSRALQQCLFNRKYLLDNIQKYDFVVLGGSWGTVLTQNKMNGALDLIKLAATKSKLVVLMPTPKQFDVDAMFLFKRSLMFKADFDLGRVSTEKDIKAKEANQMLASMASKFDNVLYIDRESMFSANGSPSDLTKDQIPFSLDGRHISVYGSKAAAESFMKSPQYQELQRRLN